MTRARIVIPALHDVMAALHHVVLAIHPVVPAKAGIQLFPVLLGIATAGFPLSRE